MKKSVELDWVGVIGAAASVGALLLVFYILKHPTSNSKTVTGSSIPMTVGQPLIDTQGTGSSPNLPSYDTAPSTSAPTYNIGGDTITSDFCSSCG